MTRARISLAGAAFTAEQDGCLAGRRLEGDVERLPHDRVFALQIDFRHEGSDLGLQFLHVRLHPASAGNSFENEPQLIGSERLGHVIEGPKPHRFHGRFHRGVGRDDDDVQGGS